MATTVKKSRARKTSAIPSKVYKYGIFSHQVEIEGRTQVEEQSRLANRYRNRLVEIERSRRRRYNEAVLQFPEVAALAEQIDRLVQEMESLREAIKAPRQERRARIPVDPEKRQRIEQIKQLLGRKASDRGPGFGLREELAQAKQRQSKSPAVEAAQEWSYDANRAARKSEDAPFWGTYLRIEDSLKDAGRGAPPEFRRYERTGLLAVQIQSSPANQTRGLTTERLLAGADTRARLLFHSKDPTEGQLWLRVGTQEDGRQPVWAKFPVKYHRPLPPGAQIKWIWVQRTKHEAKGKWGHPDDQRVWDCCFTLEHASFDVPLKTHGHTAAINFGFRKLPGGDVLRVAYIVGTDGCSRQITCEGIQESLDWADGRHSNRDRAFNVAKEQLRIWLRDNRSHAPPWLLTRTSSESLEESTSVRRFEQLTERWTRQRNRFAGDQEMHDMLLRWSQQVDQRAGLEAVRDLLMSWLREHQGIVPSWLRERAAHSTLSQWKSIERLNSLVSHWRRNRFEGDAEIYGELYRWAQEDRHGRQHEAGVRHKAYGRRKDHYRRETHDVCQQYAMIRVPSHNFSDQKHKARPEDGESELERTQRVNFNTAAQGELMAALKLAARNSGTQIVKTPMVLPSERGISEVHHTCGHLHKADRAQAIYIQCAHCGALFDQDENTALNVLMMPLEAQAAE